MRVELSGCVEPWQPEFAHDRVQPAVAQIQALHFVERHRARADAVEDRDLIAAFVRGAIAVETFRDRERGSVCVSRGDESGRGARTEPRECRRPFG
jgi:hypothetical protein